MVTTPAPAQTYETITQAAQRLGVHPRTVRRRIASGVLPAVRLGGHLIRLRPDEVDAVLFRPIPAAAGRR